MQENDFYLILFKNVLFSRITFFPEIEYALNVMLEQTFYNKKALWLISSLSIEIANIINYIMGYFIFWGLNRFKKIENNTYFTIKHNCSKLILLVLLLSFYNNGGGIIALIAGFLTINFKLVFLVSCISSILGQYSYIFL